MNCAETTYWLQIALGFCTIFIAVTIYDSIQKHYKEKQRRTLWRNYSPDPVTLTCNRCYSRKTCTFVDDPYNTDGDCLADK